jgi:glycosyltransferase involved in cell wall biosynthesis
MKKLKICMISKYPPHKGGTSSLNYWLSRRLGELGHEVHVVTDPPETGENYLKNLDAEQISDYEPKNVKVHGAESVSGTNLKSRVSFLVNFSLGVMEENAIDVIDTKYFIPYGVAGFFLKLIKGKPLVTRHGGSDMLYLLKDPSYRTLLISMLKNSDKIILDPSKLEEIKSLGVEEERIAACSDHVNGTGHVSAKEARRFLEKTGIDDAFPIIGCFGKISRGKGLIELLSSLSKIKNEEFLLLLAPEAERGMIKSCVSRSGLERKTKILDYQPPWLMPYLYHSLTALIATEVDFPVKFHTPLTAYEAFASGKCTVISEETHEKYQFKNLKDGVDAVIVNPKDTGNYAKRLKWIIRNPEKAEGIGINAKSSARCSNRGVILKKLLEIYGETAESG